MSHELQTQLLDRLLEGLEDAATLLAEPYAAIMRLPAHEQSATLWGQIDAALAGRFGLHTLGQIQELANRLLKKQASAFACLKCRESGVNTWVGEEGEALEGFCRCATGRALLSRSNRLARRREQKVARRLEERERAEAPLPSRPAAVGLRIVSSGARP